MKIHHHIFLFILLLFFCSDKSNQNKDHFWLSHDFVYKAGYMEGFQQGILFSYYIASHYQTKYSAKFDSSTMDISATFLLDVYKTSLYSAYYVSKPKDILNLIYHFDQFYSTRLNKNTSFSNAYNEIIFKYDPSRLNQTFVDSLQKLYEQRYYEAKLKSIENNLFKF